MSEEQESEPRQVASTDDEGLRWAGWDHPLFADMGWFDAIDADLPAETVGLRDITSGEANDERVSGWSVFISRVRAYRLLTAEEEFDLGRQMAEGAEAEERLARDLDLTPEEASHLRRVSDKKRAARERMILANLRLVISIARRSRRGMELDDRVALGVRGLMLAVDRFDYTRRIKFSTYATWWIKQTMNRGIVDEGRTIRHPTSFHEELGRMRVTRAHLEEDLQRPVTRAELANALGKKQRDMDLLLQQEAICTELPPDIPDDVLKRRELYYEIDPLIEERSLRSLVDHLLEELSARDRQVIEGRFGFYGPEKTLEEIGKDLGLTRERVRQIEKRALEALHRSRGGRQLIDYVPAARLPGHQVRAAGQAESQKVSRLPRRKARIRQHRERPRATLEELEGREAAT